jgi:hypothetical protein
MKRTVELNSSETIDLQVALAAAVSHAEAELSRQDHETTIEIRNFWLSKLNRLQDLKYKIAHAS